MFAFAHTHIYSMNTQGRLPQPGPIHIYSVPSEGGLSQHKTYILKPWNVSELVPRWGTAEGQTGPWYCYWLAVTQASVQLLVLTDTWWVSGLLEASVEKMAPVWRAQSTFTSQDFLWLQEKQANQVSRLPVISSGGNFLVGGNEACTCPALQSRPLDLGDTNFQPFPNLWKVMETKCVTVLLK